MRGAAAVLGGVGPDPLGTEVGAGVGRGVGFGLGVGVGAGVGLATQIGNSELWDRSFNWLMALSRLPVGRPAATWARSEGRRSLRPKSLQSFCESAWSGLIWDRSLRSVRQPSRYGFCRGTPRKEPWIPRMIATESL